MERGPDIGAVGVEVHAAGRDDGEEQGLFLKGDRVETVTDPDGRQGWRLIEAGAKLGIALCERTAELRMPWPPAASQFIRRAECLSEQKATGQPWLSR